MKLADKLQAPYVKRWGVVGVDREQNIAEHSFVVALIAEDLYHSLISGAEQEPSVVRQMYELALWHDMAEVFTGDINSKIKREMKINDDALCPRAVQARDAQDHYWQHHIVAISDTIEAINYVRVHGFNNARKPEVLDFLQSKLNGQIQKANEEHPQFDWDAAVSDILQQINGKEASHGH